MTLIYSSTWKIKDGRLEDYKQFTKRFMSLIEQKEPQLIAFYIFFNEDETELTSIQVHPDAASMDFHMQVVDQVLGEDMREWVERADFIEPRHIEIFGAPSETLLEVDRPFVETGIPRIIKPLQFSGFVRSSAG
ncbi:MAG: hypothetical protein ACWGQW_20695 [bacterium]